MEPRAAWSSRARALLGHAIGAMLWLTTVAAMPALAQSIGTSLTIGGGSDFGPRAVVELIAGQSLPPIHYIFVSNPSGSEFPVEWVSSAPEGIALSPEIRTFVLAAGATRRVRFGIDVGRQVIAGEYRVAAQLRRADVPPPKAGQVVAIPAIGVEVLVRVANTTGTLHARTIDSITGAAAPGTIQVYSVLAGAASFQVGEREGASDLVLRLAPGAYAVRFLIAEERLAERTVDVRAGATTDVVLDVESISFQVADYVEHSSDGTLRYVELVTSLMNRLGPIEDSSLEVSITRDGRRLETMKMFGPSTLVTGSTDARERFVPGDGWKAGSYRFEFELSLAGTVLKKAIERELAVEERGSSFLIGLGVAAGVVLFASAGYATVRGHRSRSRRAPPSTGRRSTRRARL